MMRLPRIMNRLEGSDGGTSLIELAVGMLVTAMMASLMLSWVFSIAAADDLHVADDEAGQNLRFAKDEITRELRRAAALLSAGPDSFTIWIDGDHDEVQTSAEQVTWAIDPEGDLVRSLGDGTSAVRLQRLSADESWFAYDSSMPAEVTSVGITLTVFVDAPRGEDGVRSLATEISLRGVS